MPNRSLNLWIDFQLCASRNPFWPVVSYSTNYFSYQVHRKHHRCTCDHHSSMWQEFALLPSPERTCHHRISLLCEMSHPNMQTAPSDHTYDSCNLYPNTKSDCMEFHMMWLPLVLHYPLHLVRDYYLLEHNWQHDYQLLICTHLYNGRIYDGYHTPHLIYCTCLLVLRDILFTPFTSSYKNFKGRYFKILVEL